MGWYRWPEKIEDRPWKPGTQEPMDAQCAECGKELEADAPFYLVSFTHGYGTGVAHAGCWQKLAEQDDPCTDSALGRAIRRKGEQT